MPQNPLEQSLRDLPKIGTLIKDRGYRQVWRFEHEGRAYYLKFYPRGNYRDEFRRFFRGSPAMREFVRLQMMQRANVPAARAVSVLMGFRLNGKRGDAVILEAIEPSVQLDQYLNEFQLNAEPVPNRRELVKQLIELVYHLGKAKLGHSDLHLGNFLLKDGKLYLLDGYSVRTGGLKMKDVMMLGHGVRKFAYRTEMQRGWEILGQGRRMPDRNTGGTTPIRRAMQGIFRENRYFGKYSAGEWSGVFYKHQKYAWRESVISKITVSREDWQAVWPDLIARIQNDQFEVLKRTRSGDVLAGKIKLGANEIDVVIKRPRRRYWYRYLNEIGRGARPRRAWKKSWNMILRSLPTAWPLLMMEKRRFGYVTDTFIVYERIPGKTLHDIDLDSIEPKSRDMLFRRTGRILREIELMGFSHFDAKSNNWVVRDDEKLGPEPILIDIDGIRKRKWIALGIERLLRSMQSQPQYTPADSLALCQGYAPFAPMAVQNKPQEPIQG